MSSTLNHRGRAKTLRQHIEDTFETPYYWVGENKIYGGPGLYVDYVPSQGWCFLPQNRFARWLDYIVFRRRLPLKRIVQSIDAIWVDADIIGIFPERNFIPVHQSDRFNASVLDKWLTIEEEDWLFSTRPFNTPLKAVETAERYQADVTLLCYFEYIYVRPKA